MTIELIVTARRIMEAAPGKPSQADLRRATSTAYYAIFDTLARCCADEIVGSSSAKRATSEWRRVYRALEHGRSRKALREITQVQPKRVTPEQSLMSVDSNVEDFCEVLEKMKHLRLEADYDPAPLKLKRIDVALLIDEAETAIKDFLARAPADQRYALAFACIVPTRA